MDKCFACDKELGTLSWYSEVDDFNPPPKGMTKNDVICDQCAKEHKKLTIVIFFNNMRIRIYPNTNIGKVKLLDFSLFIFYIRPLP